MAPGDLLLLVTPRVEDERADDNRVAELVDGDDHAEVRADLAEVIERHDVGLDHRRPDAVARRRARPASARRARTSPTCRRGQFVEYAPLVVAAQRRRRSLEELIARTPADGLVGGVGKVDGHSVDRDVVRLHGARRHAGLWNHHKKDRLFELAERLRLPIVFFTEGGGGRPGDTDGIGRRRPRLPGVQLLRAARAGSCRSSGSRRGHCFAGNAAILGCCDVIIATEGSNIGMGGPAMIEGGGLGVYEPEAIGPIDGAGAERRRRRAVAGRSRGGRRRQAVPVVLPGPGRRRGRAPTSARCATSIPENRAAGLRRPRACVDALCDAGSVLELRRGFGRGMVTALGAHRRPAASASRQQPVAPRRRDRRRRGRQGGALPAAVRRVRPAGRVPVRHARVHGRPGAEATRRACGTVAACSSPARTSRCRSARSCCARATGSARRRWPAAVQGAAVLRRVADGRVRRHEPRGRGATRPAARARGDRGSRRARARVPGDGRADVRARQGASTWRATSRSTTSSTPPTPAAGSPRCSTPRRRPPRREGKKRPYIDTW